MGDKLSQSEIDLLLSSFMSGDTNSIDSDAEIEKREAKFYDFARPSKINKEQLRSLHGIHDSYSRLLSSFLTGYLRTTVNIEVASAEQVTYSEFNSLLVNPVILCFFQPTPLKGTVVLEISSAIGYAIIDRILGGPGSEVKISRDFSDIEKILLEKVTHQMLSFVTEAWDSTEKIKPLFEKIETNSQFAQIIPPSEMTALITLSIKIGTVEGLMNFCIPHSVLEPILEKLNTRFKFNMDVQLEEEVFSDKIEKNIETTRIPIRANVGKAYINVSDFVHLQVGDIIPLDSFVSSDMNIMVGDMLKYKAKPGISRGKNAVQITSLVDKEE